MKTLAEREKEESAGAEMEPKTILVPLTDTPTPDPSPQGGGEACRAPAETIIIVAFVGCFTWPPAGRHRAGSCPG